MAAALAIPVRRTRVVRHCDDNVDWEMVRGEPDPRLAAYVHGSYTAYVEHAARPMRRQQAPFAGIPLIISFGPSIRLCDPREPAAWREHRSFMAGLHDRFVLTEYSGAQYGVQVDFTPVVLRCFSAARSARSPIA